MQWQFCIVAAIVSLMMGCGNERNGYGASKTLPRTTATTVTMGRPGDHWVDAMQFLRVARANRNNQYGYEVTYEAPGGTTFTLFWSRDQIDFQGASPCYHLETMPLGDGRLLYPEKLTETSLPKVYQAIQLIENGHARDAEGAITAAEMFGIVAALGGASPAPRATGTAGPPPRRVPPSRASVPSAQAARGGGVLSKLKLRPDVVLTGGRGGQNVKNLVGPPNTAVRGGGERVFVTNEKGRVILDITKQRVKPVTPGQGFGPKRAPTQEELSLLDKMLGGG